MEEETVSKIATGTLSEAKYCGITLKIICWFGCLKFKLIKNGVDCTFKFIIYTYIIIQVGMNRQQKALDHLESESHGHQVLLISEMYIWVFLCIWLCLGMRVRMLVCIIIHMFYRSV